MAQKFIMEEAIVERLTDSEGKHGFFYLPRPGPGREDDGEDRGLGGVLVNSTTVSPSIRALVRLYLLRGGKYGQMEGVKDSSRQLGSDSWKSEENCKRELQKLNQKENQIVAGSVVEVNATDKRQGTFYGSRGNVVENIGASMSRLPLCSRMSGGNMWRWHETRYGVVQFIL